MTTRRDFLTLGSAGFVLSMLPAKLFAKAPRGTPMHGLSAFGELKYPADFTAFGYVDRSAPKGGTLNFQPPNWGFNQNTVTFNTLNSFTMRGDAPPRMELCFDTLMTRALDEPDALYGLIAKTATISEDGTEIMFELRPEARFHDGSPLTAEDVAFSYTILKEHGHPSLSLALDAMTEAVAEGPQSFRLRFSRPQNEKLFLQIAVYPIFSKAYYDGKDFAASTMEPPLGSGAYNVGRVQPGTVIEYERVPDYWGADLPVNRGQNNFDRIRIEFYQNRQASFEAFKKGQINFRQEFSSQSWATGYDFPALREKRVIRGEIPATRRPMMQGMALNQRRERFRDVRVRRALALCFDFEWTNRNFFYGSYVRSNSYFETSDFKASGPVPQDELALLEPLRGKIPDEAFGEAFVQPASDGSGSDRKLLSQALKLFNEAGWKREGSRLVNDMGEPFRLQLMIDEEIWVRVFGPFVKNLRAIGVDASLTSPLDGAQYQLRMNDFDFDAVTAAFSFTSSPGRDELEQFFHSRTAQLNGSRNLPGIADPGVDALIEMIAEADSRESLNVSMRALDRVLRARLDWIPNWHSANQRLAYWDEFGFPETQPEYGFPVETLWWHDKEKAKAIGRG
ncbi:extracellular solute-binding protein [Limoniibacter endophyticus]|uniref:ABC transporter substrate-binding protein n=1 Tax=Limoniibacter endophyticus TaxID=1565040 RepID=A0A8J3GGU4_9HYPH|nr:extracellular solute-binding protein [Limoniibacter endophyticus]GHC67237.1 ABC transporter substrate-binding protein [Limoniibacter endophyticus]